jgi:hypothetical protein
MVGHRYRATIQENIVRKVATGKEDRHLHLISLDSESDAG